MRTIVDGSVRVDLLGGTLDIYPLNHVIPDVVTINCATGLKAKSIVDDLSTPEIKIISEDYDLEKTFSLDSLNSGKLSDDEMGPLKFLLLIIKELQLDRGFSLTISSNAPTGSGLGGSSTMGCVVYKSLCQHFDLEFDPHKAINFIQRVESKILGQGPAGYQDYYPSYFGGMLGLIPCLKKGVQVEQLYNENFIEKIQGHFHLIYSGETRSSGINNWEVYKAFFDQKKEAYEGLNSIAVLAKKALDSIKSGEAKTFIKLVSEEGRVRESLFPKVTTPLMKEFEKKCLAQDSGFIGLKVCGAGGGGCFLAITLTSGADFSNIADELGMKILPFTIDTPNEL